MLSFDPSTTASHKLGIFGVPTTYATSRLALLPVPWDVTTSYGSGAALGPGAILKASPQIDLFDLLLGRAYEQGYHLLPSPQHLETLNERLSTLAQRVRDELEETQTLSEEAQNLQREINEGCESMVSWVYSEARKILEDGKLLGLIGGDHSSPEGAIRAIGEKYHGQFGILHIDAHADLRPAYQGFTHSHASIMYNVMNSEFRPQNLVQVGVRDFSEEEYEMIQKRSDIFTFYDNGLKEELLSGISWSLLCKRIVDELPQNVYISWDIDGLSPEFCPNTGTPVPGGLSFDQAIYLLSTLAKSGRHIIGFDLNEVAPATNSRSEWDGNVGARLLFKLCGWTVLTNKP